VKLSFANPWMLPLLCGFVVAAVSLVSLRSLENYWSNHRPELADPAVGAIYPEKTLSSIVFLAKPEHELAIVISATFMISCAITVGLGFAAKAWSDDQPSDDG